MRKITRRRGATSKSAGQQVLQLSKETIRTLTPEELVRVVQAGDVTCPTGSATRTNPATFK